LNTRTEHGPRHGGPRGPPEWPSQKPPRAGFASLEGSRLPRAGSTSLEGQHPPRAGSASLEGSPPPRSRLPHKRACSRTRVRAFNALIQQSRAITRPGITPRRCSANSLGEAHPRHCRELCGMACVSPAALCCPLPYGQRAAPSKGAGCILESFPRESAGSNHDVRPAGAPSPPLLVLCGRPRACCATPGTAATTPALLNTRVRDATTLATIPRTEHRQRLPRARLKMPRPTTTPSPSKTATVRVQDTPRRQDRSKDRQDGRQLHGAARHTSPCS
jgi:hypothetical protein